MYECFRIVHLVNAYNLYIIHAAVHAYSDDHIILDLTICTRWQLTAIALFATVERYSSYNVEKYKSLE